MSHADQVADWRSQWSNSPAPKEGATQSEWDNWREMREWGDGINWRSAEKIAARFDGEPL